MIQAQALNNLCTCRNWSKIKMLCCNKTWEKQNLLKICENIYWKFSRKFYVIFAKNYYYYYYFLLNGTKVLLKIFEEFNLKFAKKNMKKEISFILFLFILLLFYPFIQISIFITKHHFFSLLLQVIVCMLIYLLLYQFITLSILILY